MKKEDNLGEQESPNEVQSDNLTTEETTTDNLSETATPEGFLAETDKMTSEIAELKDKYLRLYADFENFRRRTLKEKSELVNTANESLLQALLPVVDDFERALQSMDAATDVTAVKEGVTLIYSKLLKTLESKGLKPMVSKGEPFDADLHESITQFSAPSPDLKGKVIDEVEKGYYLNDKVIRFAKVIVGS